MDPGPTDHPRRLSVERISLAQRWTLRAGLFLLPLAYSPFTYDSFVLPKLLLARLLVVVLVVLAAARVVATRELVLKRTPLDLPLLAFLGSAALSTVFAENRNVALFGTYTRYDGLFTLVTFAALFWLTVHTLADQADARVLLRVLLASGYAVAAVAIAQSLHDSIQYATVAPAFGTLGNPNVLGAFLGLVIALAAGELLLAKSVATWILLVNVLVVCGLALVLSFSRSAWFATVTGVAFVAVARRGRLRRLAPLATVLGVVVAVLVAAYAGASHGQLERALVDRALTALDLHTVAGSRTGIWGDTLRMVAGRPVIGSGPDNFGLVFPRFQTGDWGQTGRIRQPIDKAHAELLQVAATQGVVGAATYVLMLAAFVRTFWRARHIEQSVLVAGGWLGYQLVVQVNFTALASALPFWIFAAAAMTSCEATCTRTMVTERRRALFVIAPVIAAVAALVAWGVITPYLADVRLRQAVDADFAGRPQDAHRPAAEARQLGPRESVYAVEVGNIAFEQNAWAAARAAYQDAAALGTFNALVYRNLALADRSLGLLRDAREAARKAVELDRFDPANQALLAEFETGP